METNYNSEPPDKYNDGEPIEWETAQRNKNKNAKLAKQELSISSERLEPLEQVSDRPNQNETLYVHMVPHSEMLTGWKKTLE